MSDNVQVLPQKMASMSLAGKKAEEYVRLEDEDGYIPYDPVKMNKSLEHGYMMKFEPWDILPSTYFPLRTFNHRPLRFIYGFGFRWKELIDFAIHKKLCPSREEAGENSTIIRYSWRAASSYLSRIVREEFRVVMQMRRPYSRKADLVLWLWDNYSNDLPYPGQQKLFDAVDRVEDVLKEGGIHRRPKWYISEEEMGTEKYGVEIDFTKFIDPEDIEA